MNGEYNTILESIGGLLAQAVGNAGDATGTWGDWSFLAWPDSLGSWTAVASLGVRLAVAFVLGCLVSLIYRHTRRGQWASPTFPATLILLAILIAMVTQVIGDNVARAFSLVGALSIVRFRTVVEDTLDISFVIFAVVVGMAAGATSLWAAVLGTILVGGAAWLVHPRGLALAATTTGSTTPAKLVLRVALGQSLDDLVRKTFERCIAESRIRSVATGRGGTQLEVEYTLRLRPGIEPFALVDELNRIEGIQQVELTLSNP